MSAQQENVAPPAGTGDELAEKPLPAQQPETTAPSSTTEKQDDVVVVDKKTEEVAATPAEQTNNLSVSEKQHEQEATAAVAATPVPAPTGPDTTTTPSTSSEPTWPETPTDHPLTKFYDAFEELVSEAGHDEVYGITLSKDKPFHTKLILQKFLRANLNDLQKAKEQLCDTLKWRKEFDPVAAAEATYEKERYDGLGYVLVLENVPDSVNKRDVVTFNIYGAVKDNKKTFGDLEGFLKWRVGLMERSVQKLELAKATQPIPNFGEGPDPYQGYQVHDYLQVSFLRQDPHVKAGAKKTIETLGRYYPETLSRKFFVNVPIVMGWLYTAMKVFVARETMKKFTVLSYGNQLAAELGPLTPKEYGGTADDLKNVGEGMRVE